MHDAHSEVVRAGQAKARAAGRAFGRPTSYSDALIREAVRRHDSGETWAAAATAVGISVDWLYARLRKLRREDANAEAT